MWSYCVCPLGSAPHSRLPVWIRRVTGSLRAHSECPRVSRSSVSLTATFLNAYSHCLPLSLCNSSTVLGHQPHCESHESSRVTEIWGDMWLGSEARSEFVLRVIAFLGYDRVYGVAVRVARKRGPQETRSPIGVWKGHLSGCAPFPLLFRTHHMSP